MSPLENLRSFRRHDKGLQLAAGKLETGVVFLEEAQKY
jgi:hypothetical protein